MNHEVEIYDRQIEMAEFKKVIERLKPQLMIVSNNDILSSIVRPDTEEFENYLKEKQIPVSMWDYEQPALAGGALPVRRWMQNAYPNFILYFSIDSYWVEEYRKKNLSAEFLPFGVDERLESFRPDEKLRASLSHDLVYVGTAFAGQISKIVGDTPEALVDFFSDEIAVDMANMLNRFNSKNSSIDNLNKIYGMIKNEVYSFFIEDIENPLDFYQQAEALSYRLIDILQSIVSFSPSDCWNYFRLRSQIGYSYCQLALKLKELLLCDLRIYGEGDWASIFPSYKHAIKRLSYSEMYSCWALSKIVFCFTKKLFVNNVHERALHILGAGGFPLIDYRKDLDFVFEPGEIVSYRSMDEAKDLISFYRNNDTARLKVVAAGRARLFKSHTYRDRLTTLLNKSCEHFGLPKPKNSSQAVAVQDSNWVQQIDHTPKL